jgi:tetratricopeptide (TPR) repeat protein
MKLLAMKYIVKSIKNLFTLAIVLATVTAAGAQNLQAGKRALEMEKFSEAKKIFNDLLSNENDGDIFYYMGETYFQMEKPDSARIWFEKGITSDPKNAMNYVGLGKIHLNNDKPSEAKASFETAVKLVKEKDPIVLSLISEAYISTPHKYANEAQEYATKAVELKKNKPEPLIALGDVLLQKGKGGDAISNYIDASTIDNSLAKPHVRIGKVNYHARLFKDALAAYEKAIEVDPNYAPAYRELAELYTKYAIYPKAEETYRKHLELSELTIDKEIRLAQIMFLNKKYAEVTDMFNNILKRDSTNVFLYRLNAYTSYEVGKYEQGLKDIEKFLTTVKPEKLISSDYVYYSKLLAKTPGKDSLAMQAMERAIDLDSNEYQLYSDLAAMYTSARRYGDAVRVHERMVSGKSNPTVNDYYYLGRAYFTNKDFQKADSAFARVAEKMPESYSGWLWRARSNYYLDPNNEKALAKPYVEKFVEIAVADTANTKRYTSDLITAYEYLGYYYFINKDVVKAEENFKALLSIDPKNVKALDYFERRKKK